ncbi:MAG TPA: VWA domain-containing protein, partial [Bryobacteraceae bacterium]|nr:VWA domain-containing protein [Bryobacteraceae bacterium]
MQLERVILAATALFLSGSAAMAQQANTQAAASSPEVIKTETRLVLVDTVVTDKKGNYIKDLESKDFRVWEDNKEVSIKSFSFEANASGQPGGQKRYLVLCFDNTSMESGDQIRARDAAAKFIEANAGPDHLMAIVNFAGNVQIAQNFTADAERLKKVVSGVKFSPVTSNAPVEVASLGMPQLGNVANDFGVRSVLLALRSLAKNLASVPGRKTLVLLTSGFVLTDENRPELTATIDACNKANVAVYPIDVRGLVATVGMNTYPSSVPSPRLLPAAYSYSDGGHTPAVIFRYGSYGSSFLPQRGGGGGGG